MRDEESLRDGPNVRGLQALGALVDLELHLLTLGEGTEALSLDRGVMAEHVRAAVVLHDEPETLRIVEPLHGTSDHFRNTSFQFRRHLCRRAACCSGGLCTGFSKEKRRKRRSPY